MGACRFGRRRCRSRVACHLLDMQKVPPSCTPRPEQVSQGGPPGCWATERPVQGPLGKGIAQHEQRPPDRAGQLFTDVFAVAQTAWPRGFGAEEVATTNSVLRRLREVPSPAPWCTALRASLRRMEGRLFSRLAARLVWRLVRVVATSVCR